MFLPHRVQKNFPARKPLTISRFQRGKAKPKKRRENMEAAAIRARYAKDMLKNPMKRRQLKLFLLK